KILRRRLCVRARRCVSPCWRWRYPRLCTRLLASAQRHRPCFGNGCCRVVCCLLGWPSAVVGAFELCVCHGTRGHCRLGWHQVAIRGNRHWHVNCCVGLGGLGFTLRYGACRFWAWLGFFYFFLGRPRGRKCFKACPACSMGPVLSAPLHCFTQSALVWVLRSARPGPSTALGLSKSPGV